jgi:hypothetical protein
MQKYLIVNYDWVMNECNALSALQHMAARGQFDMDREPSPNGRGGDVIFNRYFHARTPLERTCSCMQLHILLMLSSSRTLAEESSS